MPKHARQDPDQAAPARIEAVPRRGLSRQEAARYVGISTTEFDELVREGQMPQPFRIGSRTIWDLRKLDAAFDRLSGPEEEIDRFAGGSLRPEKLGMPSPKDTRPGSLARATPSAQYPGHPNVYTAHTLAEYWTCSADHIRKLVQRGELAAIRPGHRMLRISPAAVIAFEAANSTMPDL